MTNAIKQIVDTDGEPMMEVVVNSDCSAVDMEAIHAEALEEYDARNTLYVYAPGDAAREVWNQMTPIEQTVSVELRHAEALEMNLFEDRIAAAGKLMFKHGEESAIEACHAEALELNAEIDDGKTMDMYHKWNTAPTAQIRRDMLAAAHSEALEMNTAIKNELTEKSMEFQSLPTEVQIIAAQLLADKIRDNDRRTDKEPASKLAQDVNNSFMHLYHADLISLLESSLDSQGGHIKVSLAYIERCLVDAIEPRPDSATKDLKTLLQLLTGSGSCHSDSLCVSHDTPQ
ncbi:hypothetical protein ACEV60_22260 [Enterobacter ludwigii]|uniref:hypothetical protein n=1 Tax=Enterobacter ludwigii TaxID=299767 RepID=UPI003BEEB8A6